MVRNIKIFLNGIRHIIDLKQLYECVDFLADLLDIVVRVQDLYSWLDPACVSIIFMILGVILIAFIICFLMKTIHS